MRTFLLLVIFMASVARDATAEDTQCVLERGAMVETIRAYAPQTAPTRRRRRSEGGLMPLPVKQPRRVSSPRALLRSA